MGKVYLLIIVLVVVAGGLFAFKRQAITNRLMRVGAVTNNTVSQVTPAPTVPANGNVATNNGQPENGTVSSGLNLTVDSPAEGTTVTSASVTVSGQTAPNSEITVNDKDLKAGTNGKFSTTVSLDEGQNTIVVTANDANGNFAEKDLTVTYQAPAQ